MKFDGLLGGWRPVIIAVLSATAASLFLGPYGLRVATTMFMNIALAQAWNLTGGYAGLLSLAQPAFFGTGAVAFAIMLLNGTPIAIATAGATILSVVIAVLIGFPTLRLRGHYFVVGTLLVAETIRYLVLNIDAFGFHGGIAINIVPWIGLTSLTAREFNLIFYFLMLMLATGSSIVTGIFAASRWGYALGAIRDDGDAAAALGVGTTKLLITVFIVTAAISSVVGTAWAAWLGIVEANEAYSVNLTFQIIIMVFLGGRGTVWGPVVGVIVILAINEAIGIELAELSLIVSGAIVTVIVLFLPDGLASLFDRFCSSQIGIVPTISRGKP